MPENMEFPVVIECWAPPSTAPRSMLSTSAGALWTVRGAAVAGPPETTGAPALDGSGIGQSAGMESAHGNAGREGVRAIDVNDVGRLRCIGASVPERASVGEPLFSKASPI